MIIDLKGLQYPTFAVLAYRSDSLSFIGEDIHFHNFTGVDGIQYYFRHEECSVLLLRTMNVRVIASFSVTPKPSDRVITFNELAQLVHRYCGVYLQKIDFLAPEDTE